MSNKKPALNTLLQMPDHVFGRRWPVSFSGTVVSEGSVFDISEQSLPDVCILWEIVISISHRRDDNPTNAQFGFALSDQLPADLAAYRELEPLLGRQGQYATNLWTFNLSHNFRVTMRLPIAAQGRRVALYITRGLGNTWQYTVMFIFSSIPTSIPEHPLALLIREQLTVLERIERLKKL